MSGGPQPLAAAVLNDQTTTLDDLAKELFAPFEPTYETVGDSPALVVRPDTVLDVCRLAKEEPRLDFKMLLCLAVVDYKDHLQVVYVLLSLTRGHKLFIKANLPYEDPGLPTVSSLWRGANWYEREAHDLFGVAFQGHPDLKPLVLYEGFEGFPGRKEYPFYDYQEY